MFVIDGPAGPVAAIDLLRRADHIGVEQLVADRREARALLAHAEAAARAMGLGEVRWTGYPGGIKRIRNGPLRRLLDHLEETGVPLGRDGTATLSHTLYLRGSWAAVALLLGLGSVPLAVFSGLEITWAHIVVPAVLAAAGTLFAIWQIGLLVVASRRAGNRTIFAVTAAAAAAAIVAAAALAYDRAVPAIAEMWGDPYRRCRAERSRRGRQPRRPDAQRRRLLRRGQRGEAVQRALAANRGIRTVVLAGPGGRVSVGFDLYRLFQERKLATRVDKGCASACTIAFLGGVERSISPGGRLGFHRASFPGLGDNDLYESNRDLRVS